MKIEEKNKKKSFVPAISIIVGVVVAFYGWMSYLNYAKTQLKYENLEGMVMKESESFSTHPFDPTGNHRLDHPPEEKHNNHNYVIWTRPDNGLVIVYTEYNSDPFNVLEQVKIKAYRKQEQAQLDIIKYVFGENYKEEVDADNLFVNLPVYKLGKIIEEE